jgi:hypothetical protein
VKKWLDNYSDGIMSLLAGYGISFYAYLSIVLSEIFYIWRFLPENAMLFTILLSINCIVIGIFGFLKRIFVFTKWERVVARVYCINLAIIFIIGCFINFLQNLVLYFLPIVFTLVWIFLRDIQTMRFATSNSKILTTLTLIFCNCLMWPLVTAFVTLTPSVVLMYVVNVVFESKFWVFLISFAFVALLPFISWFEESFVNENIFEIGYEVVFTKRIEQIVKELSITIDVFFTDEFADAVYKLEASDESEEAWREFEKEVKRIQIVLDNSKKCN